MLSLRRTLHGSVAWPVVFLTLLSTPVMAQDINPSTEVDVYNGLDVITVTGSRQTADDVSGSVTFIGPEELALQSYSDLSRVLRLAPGVNIQEEDGYGLRPNIGLRGSGSDRSSKVLLMEDGVLMAPAPYSAPAAYYVPMTGRMNAVEVTKGPATVKYGPNTTAGAIAFFSTPIPTGLRAFADILVSDQGRQKIHAYAGNEVQMNGFKLGGLIETYQDHADGFKEIARGDTGFSIEDYVVKFGLRSDDDRHSLQLKYQYKDEVSDETYLGLTQSDFDENPYQRYVASQLDEMVNDHTTYQLIHNLEINQDWSLTTIGYRTEFARNWRKLDRFDNSSLSAQSQCQSLDSILSNEATCGAELAVLRGDAGLVSADDVLQLRANNREYYSQGIQSAMGATLAIGDFTHNLVVSGRYHEDSVDRFQDQDGYRIDNGALVLTTDNAPGTQANRLSDARAISLYIEDSITAGPWMITAGVRYEDVRSQQKRWSTPDRNMAASSVRENNYTEFLPALSASYAVNDALTILGGVHRGFAAAPVSSRDGTDPEESTVYEAGFRLRGDSVGYSGFKIDAIGFFNDYSNLLGECTNSTGGSQCNIGEAFNGGAVDVKGLELTASHYYDIGEDITMPISLSYTYTDTEFLTTFSDSFWGSVTVGDALPYVPSHQLTASVGLEGERFGVNGVLNTVSDTRNVAGQGSIASGDLIAGRTLVDLSGHYDLTDKVALRIKIENLFDKAYVAARRPYGLRPGKPREVFVGATFDF